MGNQSTINSNAQISHRAEGRNRNEFHDGLQERFHQFSRKKGRKKNNNNQHHRSKFESQIEKLETSLPKFNGDVRSLPSF
jgi:hypothetical protein